MYKSLNLVKMNSLTPSSFVIHSLRLSLILLILFLCPLKIVDTWKKEVFLSPNAAQFRCDLRAQNSSFLRHNEIIFFNQILLKLNKEVTWII